MTRVILADDHTLVRGGIRRILEAHPGIEVVGEAADGSAAIDTLRAVEADVLVLDLKMPGADGIQVLRAAKAARPELKVIVLTMHAGREYVARAVQEGADGYLLKDSAVQDLVAAIESVVGGGSYFSPAIQQELAGLLRDGGKPAQRPQLTDREREVLALLARGLSSKEAGQVLGIGTRTVETHRANLMHKLGVKSVAVLIQVAMREGILEPPAAP
ncbi:MAG TPA: response regulator transcription factor [Vicinamibacterales bacterium]|nr:response regulator transcription factor [Vicinamibacterales bacterium]